MLPFHKQTAPLFLPSSKGGNRTFQDTGLGQVFNSWHHSPNTTLRLT